MHKVIFLSAAIFIFLIIAGCNKDNTVEPDYKSQKLLKRVVDDSLNAASVFTYSEGRIIKLDQVNPDGSKDTYLFSYDSSGRIHSEEFLRENSMSNSVYIYTHDDNNKIVKVDMKSSINPGEFVSEIIQNYYYNEKGQLTEIEKLSSSNELLEREEYSYTPEGNIAERLVLDGAGKATREDIFKYDDKKNPYQHFISALNPGQSINKNNMISYKQRVFTDTLATHDYKMNYVYDNDGYPESCTIEYNSSKKNTYQTIHYEYE